MSKAGNNKSYTSHQQRLMMEALDIVQGSRRADYGKPERNFERIAVLWQAYLLAKYGSGDVEMHIDAVDVCHMLDLVKLARLIESPDHEDSIRDRFGYQACYVDLVYSDKDEEWQDWPSSDPTSDDQYPEVNDGAGEGVKVADNIVDEYTRLCRDHDEQNALAAAAAMARNPDVEPVVVDWPQDGSQYPQEALQLNKNFNSAKRSIR